MSKKLTPLERNRMTPDQLACAEMLAEWAGGWHHISAFHEFGEFMFTLEDREFHLALAGEAISLPNIEAEWLVWSNEHRAYWRPNRAGYTTFAKAAGRYTKDQAIEIFRDARSRGPDGTPPPETMIHQSCINPKG